MTKFAKLSPSFSVAAQITEADVEAAAAQGFKSIINNRPDGEAGDQPPGAEIAAAAERHGLTYCAIPVVPGQLTEDNVAATETALAELRGPVLAYCRSGTRSATLWALAQAEHLSPDSILQAAAGAGYDLGGLRRWLEGAWSGAR